MNISTTIDQIHIDALAFNYGYQDSINGEPNRESKTDFAIRVYKDFLENNKKQFISEDEIIKAKEKALIRIEDAEVATIEITD